MSEKKLVAVGTKMDFFEFKTCVIDTANNPISYDDLMDKFIEFVEANNWYTTCTIEAQDSDTGEPIFESGV